MESRWRWVAAKAIIFVFTSMCPAGERRHLEDLYLDTIKPLRLWDLTMDGYKHLRDHGAVPVVGAAIVGLGAVLYAFTSASIGDDVIEAFIGLGILAIVPAVGPKLPALNGGCPLLAYHEPPVTARLPRLPLLTAIVGSSLAASALTIQIQDPRFDIATLIGVVISGLGITTIGCSSALRSHTLMSWALRSTAIGATLVAYGDGGWGLVDGSSTMDVIASLVTGAGGIIYGLFIADLVSCYVPRPGPPHHLKEQAPRAA